jgi:hypothetical protein
VPEQKEYNGRNLNIPGRKSTFGEPVNTDFGKFVQTLKVPNFSSFIETQTGMPQFESQVSSNKAQPVRPLIRPPVSNPLRGSFSDIHNIFPARKDGNQSFVDLMKSEYPPRHHARTQSRELTKFAPQSSSLTLHGQETSVNYRSDKRVITQASPLEGSFTDRMHTKTDRNPPAHKFHGGIRIDVPRDITAYQSKVPKGSVGHSSRDSATVFNNYKDSVYKLNYGRSGYLTATNIAGTTRSSQVPQNAAPHYFTDSRVRRNKLSGARGSGLTFGADTLGG